MKRALRAARAYLGDRQKILDDLFRASSGTPPGVPVARYRADHPRWIPALDRLEAEQLFLARHREGSRYRIRVYALPLLSSSKARTMLSIMNPLYDEFKEIYRIRLTNPISVSEILRIADAKLGVSNADTVKEALYYMLDSHAVWSGISNDFPYSDESTVCLSEGLLRQKSFSSMLSQFYEWNIINPKKRAGKSLADVLKTSNFTQVQRSTGKKRRKPATALLATKRSRIPEWYAKLQDSQKALIGEIDRSIRYGMSALPTMGLRTLVELIMRDHIPDKGTFKANLSAFEQSGYITKQQVVLIESVIDAGHAAAHRAYFPNQSDLITCVEAVRYLMEGIYILKPKLDSVSSNTPRRMQK